MDDNDLNRRVVGLVTSMYASAAEGRITPQAMAERQRLFEDALTYQLHVTPREITGPRELQAVIEESARDAAGQVVRQAGAVTGSLLALMIKFAREAEAAAPGAVDFAAFLRAEGLRLAGDDA